MKKIQFVATYIREIDTLDSPSVVIESRRSRGATEKVFTTYSEYLSQMNLANCCKKTEKWDYTYYQYPYEKFIKMRFLKKRINYKKINYPILHAAILYSLNEKRKEHLLHSYFFNYALETSASEHALNMQVYNFFSHTSPFQGKETPGRRAHAAGFPYTAIGQTIEKQFGIEYNESQHPYLFTPDVNGDYFSLEPKGKRIKNHTYLGLAEDLIANLFLNNEDRQILLSPDYRHFGVGLRHYKERNYFEMDMFYVVLVAASN